MRERNKWLIIFAIAIAIDCSTLAKASQASPTGTLKATPVAAAIKNSSDQGLNNPETSGKQYLPTVANGASVPESSGKAMTFSPDSVKQNQPKKSRWVVPVRRVNRGYTKREEIGKNSVGSQKGQATVKQDKNTTKKGFSNPTGRPELKPEFAKPDRAPGPPLGDHMGNDENRKRR
ncbi:MAG: hypothetical protein ACP5U1_05935 [Desulfomonilaceae bacterium]